MKPDTLKKLLPILIHIGALLPLAIMIWGFFDNQFFNPIQELTFRTGRYALHLLILSLACTPLNTLFGWRWAISVRKMLGLYAFMYAALHFSIFVGLDYGFNWELLLEAIFEKRYALVGFSAFLILLPLAITSTKGWMKRLGKTWKRLHQWVYLAALLVIVHFIWLVKGDTQRPLIYGAVVLLLLVFRLPPVRKWAGSLRRRRRKPPAKNASLV